jgi:predicted RNA binding protein YcfA (HicA-like mRNA interferase family)
VVLSALLRIGWSIKRQRGSHRTLERSGWPDFVFAFHDGDEIGPKMLARIAKRTGLRPEDLCSEVVPSRTAAPSVGRAHG